MPKFASIWDVTPETAHPRARQLLAESIIWNYGDEDSPLGNDTGADTFAAYLNFRAAQPAGAVRDFIREQLAAFGIPDADWDILDEARVKDAIEADKGFALL